jgi:hypothetical protein
LLYTTTATNILRAKYVNIAGVKDLGVIDTKNNFGINEIKCKEVLTATNTYDSVCMVFQDASSVLDLTLNPTGQDLSDVALTIKSAVSLNYFSQFTPVYVEFEKDLAVVKGIAFNNAGVPQKESMLFYKRIDSAATSASLYWGLTPADYFNEWKDTDITTVSIPVTTTVINGTDRVTSIYFTQLQTIDPIPSSGSTSSTLSSKVNGPAGTFSAFSLSNASISIDEDSIVKSQAD